MVDIYKIGAFFMMIWNFIKYFFVQLFTAIKFAVINYDLKLQETKTPKQRALIWTAIGAVTLLVLYIVLSLLGNLFLTLLQFNPTPALPQQGE